MEPKLDYFFHETEEFVLPDVFQNAAYPWEALENADRILKEASVWGFTPGCAAMVSEDVHIQGDCAIGKGTIVHSGVTIMGPVVIGENCQIMPGALIRPGTIIGNNCVIGHGCEIKHSIVQNGAKVQSMSFVGDSVIGRSARVGSGVIVANRRFDQSTIPVKADSFSAQLETAFFGCVLGDYARLGANSVTQPGSLIGPYTWVYPGTAVRGFIPACKRVRHPRPLVMDDHAPVALKP